jgi:hypothetical protein
VHHQRLAAEQGEGLARESSAVVTRGDHAEDARLRSRATGIERQRSGSTKRGWRVPLGTAFDDDAIRAFGARRREAGGAERNKQTRWRKSAAVT